MQDKYLKEQNNSRIGGTTRNESKAEFDTTSDENMTDEIQKLNYGSQMTTYKREEKDIWSSIATFTKSPNRSYIKRTIYYKNKN